MIVMTGYRELSKDLLVKTLSSLPVKSLMRFSCVFKYWFSSLKDPNFICKHLKRFDNMCLMVHIIYATYNDPYKYLISNFILLLDKTLTELHFQNLEAKMGD